MDPFLTIALSFLLQKYCPKETTSSSPKSAISSVVERVLSGIVTIGAGWGVSSTRIYILMEGIIMEDVEIIEAWVKEMDVEIDVMG